MVVDTNVLIAALIVHGAVREVILRHPASFLTPQACLDELWEHTEVWNRRHATMRILRQAVAALCEDYVAVIPRSVYRGKEPEARLLIDDPDDVPVVSLALAVDNEGIWTFNTRDFRTPRLTARLRVLTTGEIDSVLRT